jgi:cell division septal protein FtsQ
MPVHPITRRARGAGKRSQGRNSSQDFLSKPPKRRRQPAKRQHRQEQATPSGVRVGRRNAAAKPTARPSALRILAAVLAVALIGLAAYLFSSDSFYVQTAAIRGLQLTAAEQVYRQADIDQYSVFWIDTHAAARRIEELPYIRRAWVTTSLPNQVRIEVEERQPVAVWNVNGQEYWVDSEGATMPVLAGAAPSQTGGQELPVLWDLDGSTATADGRLDQQLIASVRQVWQQAPEVTDFGYDRTKGLQFRFPGGTYVYLGHPDGIARRVKSLLVLHQSLASQGQMPAEINWRDEDGFTLRLAQ